MNDDEVGLPLGNPESDFSGKTDRYDPHDNHFLGHDVVVTKPDSKQYVALGVTSVNRGGDERDGVKPITSFVNNRQLEVAVWDEDRIVVNPVGTS